MLIYVIQFHGSMIILFYTLFIQNSQMVDQSTYHFYNTIFTLIYSHHCRIQVNSCVSAELRYGGLVMHFDYVWLRDHCRSASCYNSKTNQRNLDTASIDLNIRPSKSRVDENNLFLTCKCRTSLIQFS